MYQIILLKGTPEYKAEYISKIIKSIPNSVYLNINNLYSTFSKPLSAKMIEEKFDDRIKKPSHEVILQFAHSNMKLDKVAIIDGNYDLDLITQNLSKVFGVSEKPTIRTIHFAAEGSGLEKISKDQLIIDVMQERVVNNQKIKEFISDIVPTEVAEEKAKSGLLVMSAGLAGSGKTTLLEPIVKQIPSFCYFDSDIPTIPFLIGNPLVSEYYAQYVKNPRYEIVLNFAIDNIIHYAKSAVIDGCFGDKLTSPLMRPAFTMPGVIPTVVYCHCTGDTQKIRIIERGAERDKEKLKDLPADRRNNIEKHLVEFAQVDNVLYIDTEERKQHPVNIQKLLSEINSPDFKPLSIRPRTTPFDKKLCAISKEKAQEGMSEFQLLLGGIKLEDYQQAMSGFGLFKKDSIKRPLQRSISMPLLNQRGLK